MDTHTHTHTHTQVKQLLEFCKQYRQLCRQHGLEQNETYLTKFQKITQVAKYAQKALMNINSENKELSLSEQIALNVQNAGDLYASDAIVSNNEAMNMVAQGQAEGVLNMVQDQDDQNPDIVQPINNSEEYGKKYEHKERIEIDFYPLTVKLKKLETTLKTKFAEERIFFFLTSSDTLSDGLKDFVDIEIQGKSSFQNARIFIDKLPCSLTLELKWPADMQAPSQDSGDSSYAMGEYNAKTSIYTISHGDGMGGDSLAGIAKRFDTSVPAIMDLNDMASKSLEGIKTLKIPDTSFVASSPDNYEIHSPFYTNMLVDMLAEGQSIEEVMNELFRLQNKGYKDKDSKNWAERKYDSKEGEAITGDYRNPEGTMSIQGYTNAKDGQPVRFTIYDSIEIDGEDVPKGTGSTIFIDYVVPEAKEGGIMDRIFGDGWDPSAWQHSGPYWLFTGELGEDYLSYDEFKSTYLPIAVKGTIFAIGLCSFGLTVVAYKAGEASLASVLVTGSSTIFSLDELINLNHEGGLIYSKLGEDGKKIYNILKVGTTIGAGANGAVMLYLKPDKVPLLKVFSILKSVYGGTKAFNQKN